MKKILVAFALLMPLVAKTQAHIGVSLSGLKDLYPEKEIVTEHTNEGEMFSIIEQPLGLFFYIFDKETSVTRYCFQIPYSMEDLNTLVKFYNKKYVALSDEKWVAYLEGGGKMNITLEYDEKMKSYVFTYTD